jgi:hypothetical protein
VPSRADREVDLQGCLVVIAGILIFGLAIAAAAGIYDMKQQDDARAPAYGSAAD